MWEVDERDKKITSICALREREKERERERERERESIHIPGIDIMPTTGNIKLCQITYR